MPSGNPDDTLLLIRCPSCGQRFKVGEDLKGRTVECGGCEHRFRINDDVIVRGRKFYPGERKDPSLNRFQRVPLAMATGNPVVQTVRYGEPPDPAEFEPAPPLRILAGAVGAILMILMALLLILGAHRGGALDGMTTQNRLMMAGFTALLGVVLLVYGNRRARAKAAFFGVLMAAGLISIPFFFTKGSIPLDQAKTSPPPVAGESSGTAGKTAADLHAALRITIGTGPLDAEIERLAQEGSTKKAVGLWLRDLRETNRIVVRDYLLNSLNADPRSHPYPRGGGDYLMVITGIDKSLSEVSLVAGAIGSVERTIPELSVIEVMVNNDNFVEGPIEKLTNRNDPAFYDLNKRELESIDPERVSRAVKRLVEAEPKIYRSDITRKLIALLEAPWVEFKGDVCRALAVWSETPGPAGEAALAVLKEAIAKGQSIPPDLVQLIVKERNPGVIPFIEDLWSRNPIQWESIFAEVGPAAEPGLLRRFTGVEGSLRHSAVRLLGRVGGEASLPILEAAMASADPELKVLIEKSVEAIRSRMAG